VDGTAGSPAADVGGFAVAAGTTVAGLDVAVAAIVVTSRVGATGAVPTGAPQVDNPNIASAAKMMERERFIARSTFYCRKFELRYSQPTRCALRCQSTQVHLAFTIQASSAHRPRCTGRAEALLLTRLRTVSLAALTAHFQSQRALCGGLEEDRIYDQGRRPIKFQAFLDIMTFNDMVSLSDILEKGRGRWRTPTTRSPAHVEQGQ
jgi:hypothetical protein